MSVFCIEKGCECSLVEKPFRNIKIFQSNCFHFHKRNIKKSINQTIKLDKGSELLTDESKLCFITETKFTYENGYSLAFSFNKNKREIWKIFSFLLKKLMKVK